ncbi:MAG: type II toxin-antitoxin system VapC family toxin [Alphaproteobacteria bacterium]
MIILDTHVLVWWVSGQHALSRKAASLIGKNISMERSILVSAISAWEIAMLAASGRLVLSMDIDSWLAEVARIPAIAFIPVDNSIAVKSTQLPGEFHKDPADRMIVALARQLSLELITADEKILQYTHVKTVW